MKKVIPGIVFAICFAACRDAETKVDRKDTTVESKTDTITVAPKPPEEIKKDIPAPKTAEPRAVKPSPATGNSEILANIDKHLVSAAQFTTAPTGGIMNGKVTITNTLTNATFQKVMVEVKILKDNGAEFRTDYYTVVNIEPGGMKLVKIPNTTQGAKVETHIIKAKSAELTKGEFILTGIHFVAN